MLLECGILLITRSLDKYHYITAELLDFILCLGEEFDPIRKKDVQRSICFSFNKCVRDGVIK